MKSRGASISHPLGEMDLPEQLPQARLDELVGRVRSGVATEGEISELAMGHIRLAMSIAARHAARAIHLQDVLVGDALFGLALALKRAPEKLYDDNITGFIVQYIRKYCLMAVTQDRMMAIPYSTLRRRRKEGKETIFPRSQSAHKLVSKGSGSLLDLKDMIESCIKNDFEQTVIELRKLGYRDNEIAEKLGCSRSPVTKARKSVKKRYEEAEAELDR